MRGRAASRLRPGAAERITPAYAGKRTLRRCTTGFLRDHPRVCGEELSAIGGMYYELGSPPRMRGRVIRGLATRITSGITPAYAGKSYTRTCYAYNVRDHPRVCGEESSPTSSHRKDQGSPPRMRGRVYAERHKDHYTGITPAYAGKRLKKFHSIGHFSCILCLFHSVLHRASASGGSRAGPCAPPCLPAQNAIPV